MKIRTDILIIVVLCFYSGFANALPGTIFNITKLQCHANSEWVEHMKYDLTLNEKHLSVVNFEAKVIKPIEKIMVHVKSYIKQKDSNDYRDGLYDFKLNGCAFLNGKGTNPITQVFLSYVRQTMHIPYRCPLQGIVNIKNFTIKSELVPVVSQPGEYKFVIKGYLDEPKIEYGEVEVHIATMLASSLNRKSSMKIF